MVQLSVRRMRREMSYDANSIKVRNFREACRAQPSMYLGADKQDATFNCFLEILNNACDEAMVGRGNIISIEAHENEITVSDIGAGCPRGSNKDCEEVLIEIFTTAHSSGKFDNNSYAGGVRGAFGVGSSAVCVCSEKFEVWTKRDGAEWHLLFKEGIPQDSVARPLRKTKDTGTKITFRPNKTIFHIPDNEPCFEIDRIRNEIELTSYFIPNVTFIFKTDEKEEKFLSKNGLKDFAISKIKNPLHSHYIYDVKQFEDNVKIEVFAQWTSEKEKCYVFSNGALNVSGGTPVSGMKTAFTRAINDFSNGNFDGDMIRKGLVTIINIRHPHPIYQNQIKDKIQNNELRGYTQSTYTEAIKDWALKYPDEKEKIINLLTKEAKAEAAADRARQAILNHERKENERKSKKISMPDKFKDCEKHDENSMLIICEGNSALAGLMPARDVNTEALYAVRGKIKNLLKHPLDECLENQEVSDIILALGCGIQEKYNARKLNYGKVAIAVDGDAEISA